MKFGLSDEQKLLQATVERLLTERGAEAAEAGLAELGIFETELSMLDAAVIQEALGGAAAPAASLAGLALGRRGALAFPEGGVRLEGGQLFGDAPFVIDAGEPELLVAIGESLYRVEGARLEAISTIDATRQVARTVFDGAPAERIGEAEAARRRLWVLLAADALGAAQTMLDRAVAYAKERRQFGRTIGSFQAVKHMCAEMAAALEPCRALVWYAAHAQDALPDEAPLIAALAKSHVTEVARDVARTATEVHGGMGFTELSGLPRFFKRIGFDRQALGGPEAVRAHAARLQGLAAA
jgi:hypothetical protein